MDNIIGLAFAGVVLLFTAALAFNLAVGIMVVLIALVEQFSGRRK